MKRATLSLLAVLLNFYPGQDVLAATMPSSTSSESTAVMTLEQEQAAYDSSQALVDAQNELITLATYTGSPTLTAAANLLEDALQANAGYRDSLNLLYGTTISTAGTNSSFDNTTLNSIVAQTGYNQASYLNQVSLAGSLALAMRTAPFPYTAGQMFNRAYGTTLTPTGTPSSSDRAKLMAVVLKTGYNQTNFMNLLVNWTTATSKSLELAMAVQGVTANRSDFNLIYAGTVPSTGNLSTTDKATIDSITVATGYDQNTTITRTQKSASLYRQLQASSTYRTAFNTRYTATIQSTGSPNSSDRTKIFNVVNQTGYNESTFLASLLTAPPPPPPSGQLFSPTSFWNTKLTTSTPIHWNSTTYVNEMLRLTQLSGGTWINTTSYTTPVYYVNSSTPKVKVSLVQGGVVKTFTKLHSEWQKGVPIPPDVIASAGTDGHLTIIDTSTDTLYEFWRFKVVNGVYQAEWGGILYNMSQSTGIMPITTNLIGGKESWGASASGLPVIGGTILLKELQAGVIPHALALAIPQPAKGTFVWPANRTDGWNTSANAIPEGMRFKFPANIYIDPSWSPIIKMMVIAVRDYGLVVRDQAGSVSFFTEDRSRFGSNPYPAYYGGKQLWDVVKQFPWSKLQTLA